VREREEEKEDEEKEKEEKEEERRILKCRYLLTYFSEGGKRTQ